MAGANQGPVQGQPQGQSARLRAPATPSTAQSPQPSYEPMPGHGQQGQTQGHRLTSPPHLAQAAMKQAVVAQQVALVHGDAPTARRQWDVNAQPSPVQQRGHSVQAPASAGGHGAGSRSSSVTGLRGGSLASTPSSSRVWVPEDLATARAALPQDSPEPRSAVVAIEVPVESGGSHRKRSEVQSEYSGRTSNRMLSEVQKEQLACETAENVKEVHLKVESIEHFLKTGGAAARAAQEEIKQLHEQLRAAKDELREARELVAAKEAAALKVEASGEAKISELEWKLQDFVGNCGNLKQRQESLEQELHKREKERDELRERYSREVAALNKANRTLEAELSDITNQFRELEAEHLSMKDVSQTNHGLESQLSSITCQYRELEAEHMALKDATQASHSLESQLHDVTNQYRDLQAENRALKGMSQTSNGLESRLSSITEQYRELEAENKALRNSLQTQSQAQGHTTGHASRGRHSAEEEASRVQALEQQTSLLRAELADFEQQKLELERRCREGELELERQRQDHEQFCNDQVPAAAMRDKEYRQLRQALQDQKKELWALEGMLRKERAVASFITPGEFFKLAKRWSEEDLSGKYARAQQLISGLEFERKELTKRNEVMRRHFPKSAWEAALRELEALP